MRLPRFWVAQNSGGRPYKVVDCDTWEVVADKFSVDVDDLIMFNFTTLVPAEINWCLRRYVGCKLVSPSGNNWMFSTSASPGIIYIPPATVDGDEHEVCGWAPPQIGEFFRRLEQVAKAMSGHRGARIKKLVRIIVKAGYAGRHRLWYYNPAAVAKYVEFHTKDNERRDMTSVTGGRLPFSGSAGVNFGDWQVFPVVMMFDEFACGSMDFKALAHRLEWIDDQMYQGWHAMDLVDAQSSQGGGSGYGDLVPWFINHVRVLSKDPNHLYASYN